MLTLDDIMAAPSDPEELNKHLIGRGLIQPPIAPPALAPVTVGPLSPVRPEVAPMVPPKPEAMNSIAGALNPGEAAPMAAPAAPKVPALHPLSKEQNIDMSAMDENGALPELTGATAPGGGGAGIVKPMVPPRAPTGAESISAGMAEHPGLSAKEEGKRQFQELRPPITADPGSAEFTRQKLAQAEFDKAHPWGGDISAHPGLLGKIGHIASKVGNIAGDIVAPGIMANIPGTDIEKANTRATLKNELATRTAAEEGSVTKGLQQEETKTRLAKEQNEQSIEKDAQGNPVGWTDAKGVKHSLEEEGTPQAIKDIAEASKSKGEGPRIEKTANGDIVQITTDKDGKAKSERIYKGDPKVETDLTTRTVGGQEHHILVNKGTGEDIKDLGAFKTEPNPAKELAKEKSDEEPVIGFDKNGVQRLMARGQAQKEGLTHLVKSSPKDRADAEQNTSALNDMGAKVKNLFETSKAIDKLGFNQKTLIQSALRGHRDDYSTRMAISMMAPEAQKFTTDVFNLREAALALPKQTTGGSRVSEPQAEALWNTVPGSAGDHKYRENQLRKFNENLTRLWKKVPRIEGNEPELAFPEEGGTGGAKGGATAAPAVGTVIDGHRFKGGDPADKKNWEKQ